MKFLLKITLAICVLIELSSANVDLTQDKHYPFHDLFYTKAHEFTTASILESGHTFFNIWSDFNETISSGSNVEFYNSEDFKKISQEVMEFFDIIDQLEADKNNCDALKFAQEKILNFWKYPGSKKVSTYEKFVAIADSFVERKLKVLIPIVKETYEKIPIVCESYEHTLTEVVDKENDEAWKWCENFKTETNELRKFELLQKFATLSLIPERIEPDTHCKWNYGDYVSFTKMLEHYHFQLAKAKE